MKRDFKLSLKDILACCQHIEEFIEGMEVEAFQSDERTSSAVIRKLEVIGEASKNIPDGIKSQYPRINWNDVAGMRDRLIHGYFGVDSVLVWDTPKTSIPRLASVVSQMLRDLEGQS